jgi:hypothetical protein
MVVYFDQLDTVKEGKGAEVGQVLIQSLPLFPQARTPRLSVPAPSSTLSLTPPVGQAEGRKGEQQFLKQKSRRAALSSGGERNMV